MVLPNDNMVTWPPLDLHCVMEVVVWAAICYTMLVVCVGMHENDDFWKKKWGKTMLTLIFFRPF
jgi:hypothetical protein